MLGSVFAKTLVEQRRALIWWAMGLVAACLLAPAFYPSIHENAASFERLLDSLPEGLRRAFGEDFASPAGYLQARLFSIFAPVLFLIFAIGAGSRAIAGEEEHKTLDLLLSTPFRVGAYSSTRRSRCSRRRSGSASCSPSRSPCRDRH